MKISNLITYWNNKNNLLKIILFLYFTIQSYFLFEGGVTYDEKDYRYGSQVLLNKLYLILNGEFSNSIFDSFITIEYFGLIFIFPAYLFSTFLGVYLPESIYNNFLSADSLYYLLTHVFLNILTTFFLYLSFQLMSKLKGKNFGILFIIFLVLTPSFSGHALFNFKDVPYLFCLLIFKLYILSINSFDNNKLVISGMLLGICALTRINAYLFISFFIIIYFFYFKFIFKNKKKILNFNQVVRIYLYSFITLYLLSPQGWVSPASYFYETINHQFFHKWDGTTLTNGEFVNAQNISSTYLFNWFLVKLPIIYIVSCLLIFIFFKKLKKDFILFYSFSLISTVFLSFTILKPTAYDGIRHFLFLIPYFVYIFISLCYILSENLKINISFFFLLSMCYLLFTQFGLQNMRYTYFNEIVNIDSAGYHCEENIDGCGDWITDYWGYSGKTIGNSLIKYVEPGSTVLICKPFHSFDSYIDTNIFNLTRSGQDYENFYTVSFHRPRENQDSCFFYIDNIDPDCKLVKEYKARIRTNYLTVGYLNICKLDK